MPPENRPDCLSCHSGCRVDGQELSLVIAMESLEWENSALRMKWYGPRSPPHFWKGVP